MALLDGKVAIVAGAGRGIGRSTALLLAREGASVVVNDTGGAMDGTGRDESVVQSVVDEIVAAGGRAVGNTASVASREGAFEVVDAAIREFGALDVLVNCAGILLEGSLFKVTQGDFDEMLRVQLGAALWCTQAAGERMRKAGTGSIIMTTSTAGLLGNFGQSALSAANAGVYGLMRTACIELQRHHVRVNAVAPLAKTRLTEALPLFEQVQTMTPAHVAPAYLFLASDLSRDVTGTVLSAAGGRLSVFRMTESSGSFKETADGIWSATEIAEHFATIRR